jgi:mannose-6-phosphate isomerase-like protein (cupin superfamily)
LGVTKKLSEGEIVMATFQSRKIGAEPDVIAPDGSEVRLLIASERGSMAHFRLAAGAVSKAVRHRTVEELWYFVGGQGEMWRCDGRGEEVVPVVTGVSISIPVGTTFQFRATGDSLLEAVAVTMPPWPGTDEAEPAEGLWPPTV